MDAPDPVSCPNPDMMAALADPSVSDDLALALLTANLSLARRQAVEVQEEVVELRALFDLQLKREKPWVARWQQETGKPDTLPDYGDFIAWLLDKADRATTALGASHNTLVQLRSGFSPEAHAQTVIDRAVALIAEAVRLNCPGGQPGPCPDDAHPGPFVAGRFGLECERCHQRVNLSGRLGMTARKGS